jgi:outer membrane protein assembly factor BamB
MTGFSGFNVPSEPAGTMNELRLWVFALDLHSGELVWKREVKPDFPEQDRIREDHGYASNTPVSDGQRLFVFFGKSGVLAYDLEGNEIWKTSVGSGLSGWGSGASPVIAGDYLIINASVESESLIALDKSTGKQIWKVGGIQESWNTPILIDGTQAPSGAPELALGMLGKVRGYDPATGQELWSCDNGIKWYIAPSMVSSQGVVWSIGGRSGTAAVAVKAGGRGDVTDSRLLWSSTRGSNVSSPVLHEERLYWAHENLGVVYCAESSTGKLIYEERLPRSGQIYASPVMAGGRIYYTSREGKTFVIGTGSEFELLAVNELGVRREVFNASPAITGDRMLIRSNQFLYCIGE